MYINVKMNDVPITRSSKVKYLGVVLDDRLSWKNHIYHIQRKCGAGLASLRRLHSVLPTEVKKNLFNALVLPHLEYCSVFGWNVLRY
jgi:hypothetical protein